jgi:hypothetical protein
VNKTASGQNINNPVNYLMKYIRKTWGSWNDEAVLTKAMLWAFNKRTFDVSRKFGEYVKSVADNAIPENTLEGIVKRYPLILDMPEIETIVKKLPEKKRSELYRLSESYGTIHSDPVPDSAINDFMDLSNNEEVESVVARIVRLINGPEPTCTLLGMIKAFKPNRKDNPKSTRKSHIVWLEERQTTNDNSTMDDVDSYTIDDLDYLAEQSALMRSTYEQDRALKFLMSAYNTGHKDWVYYIRPHVKEDPLRKLYRLGHPKTKTKTDFELAQR